MGPVNLVLIRITALYKLENDTRLLKLYRSRYSQDFRSKISTFRVLKLIYNFASLFANYQSTINVTESGSK